VTEEKPNLLSCAQPSGVLTIGNYLGAIKDWASMLDAYNCYFGVVDLHALTVLPTAADLRRNTLSCVAQYIACGLDPDRCQLFVQSHVTGHTELAWLLCCITPLGDLQRMTQFKEKTSLRSSMSAHAESDQTARLSTGAGPAINSGLLMYPVLMAADILLYNAQAVPVGEDQKQHLELCRDLAHRFNNRYSETFHIPESFIPAAGARIKSLQEPSKKMSKSDKNHSATIFILDEPQVIKKKIMSAVTDSGSEIRVGGDKPGISNLLQMHAATTGRSTEELEARFQGKGYGVLKGELVDVLVAALDPVRTRYHELMQDKSYLQSILQTGAHQAQTQANRVLSKVYRKMGLVAPNRS
jgi:tryptophanyl-tRNA synthetase